ncbi:hypothetical protein [Azospirillum sp. TSO35-2]|uniref:hypothetical protein n=1 Tax=Azospirillum sp. TSO35-2 TaxID=716796 RepID=UPI000D62266A|nr:hypothetical protein [Azospirillum sp. TSO35-2]PWC32734.1 hypothetical protein TSO352_19095 [Azospirillum sp. TSO35-2]
MKGEAMTDEQFLRHLDDFGAQPERWPAELRAAAADALARSPALRAAQAAALSFDRLLSGPLSAVDEARVARLLSAVGAAARGRPQDTLVMLLLGRMPRRTAAGLCVALLTLGWLAGTLTSGWSGPAPPPGGQAVALLSDDVATLFDGESR